MDGSTDVPAPASGSRDGQGAGDRNRDYTFGETQTTAQHGKFTTMEFARLLILRSHVQDGDRAPAPAEYVFPEHFSSPEVSLAHAIHGAPSCFNDGCECCRAFMVGIELTE